MRVASIHAIAVRIVCIDGVYHIVFIVTLDHTIQGRGIKYQIVNRAGAIENHIHPRHIRNVKIDNDLAHIACALDGLRRDLLAGRVIEMNLRGRLKIKERQPVNIRRRAKIKAQCAATSVVVGIVLIAIF